MVTMGLCYNYTLFDDQDNMITIIDKSSFKILGKFSLSDFEDEDSSGRFPHAFFPALDSIFVAFSNGSFECWESRLPEAKRRNQIPFPTVNSSISLPEKLPAMQIAKFEDETNHYLILACQQGTIVMYNAY
jgi:hypothetical protein